MGGGRSQQASQKGNVAMSIYKNDAAPAATKPSVSVSVLYMYIKIEWKVRLEINEKRS